VIGLKVPGALNSKVVPNASPTANPIGISFKSREQVRRQIYPDVLAWRESTIIVGEMKAVFSKEDRDKLLNLAESENGFALVCELLSRSAEIDMRQFRIVLFLAHGSSTAVRDDRLNHLIFSPAFSTPRIVVARLRQYAWKVADRFPPAA
jgi:hypothetical protein